MWRFLVALSGTLKSAFWDPNERFLVALRLMTSSSRLPVWVAPAWLELTKRGISSMSAFYTRPGYPSRSASPAARPKAREGAGPLRSGRCDVRTHPAYSPFEVTVRHPDSADDDMAVGYVYLISDQHGAPRYAGSTHDIEKRMERNHHSVNNLHSPLYRHLQEHGIDGWQIHQYAAVHYDRTRCPDALRRAEDDCIRQLRASGCQLLNKNAALRTSAQGAAPYCQNYTYIWVRVIGRRLGRERQGEF